MVLLSIAEQNIEIAITHLAFRIAEYGTEDTLALRKAFLRIGENNGGDPHSIDGIIDSIARLLAEGIE